MMHFAYKAACKYDVHYQPILWSHHMVDMYWTFSEHNENCPTQFSATSDVIKRRSIPKDIKVVRAI